MDYNNYVLFCSHDKNSYNTNKDRAIFSQWRYSPFTDKNGVQFNSCEQYMMYNKAILMKDYNSAKNILKYNVYNPNLNTESKIDYKSMSKIKMIGRKIANFDQDLWDKHKFDIVVQGNMYKFTQNLELKNILLNTQNKILVEAASYDKIWGIGLNEKDALKVDPKLWWASGENLLGKALMEVRKRIMD